MSPLAEPTSQSQTPVAAQFVPPGVLQGGEIIIYACKPSSWYVLMISMPLLVAAVVVTALASISRFYCLSGCEAYVYSLAVMLCLGRLTVACWQWLAKTYILTNYRVLSINGLFRPAVTQLGLTEVKSVMLGTFVQERLVGVGTVFCVPENKQVYSLAWASVAHPKEVADIISEAIRRAKPTAGPEGPEQAKDQ